MLASAEAQYRQQQTLSVIGLVEGRKAWDAIDPADINASWARQVIPLLNKLTGLQFQAAQQAIDYIGQALNEQGVVAEPIMAVSAPAFSGVASDGRSLAGLLDQPRIQLLTELKTGTPYRDAASMARAAMDRLAVTQIQDAERAAAGVAITTRPHIGGYVRMLNPPSCSRCVILAGRHYKWNDGFQRHPLCLPAGTVVSGPEMVGASRRWYDGELVVIRTAGGKKLTITANHPVLTDAGWLPANLVSEGGYVVSRAAGDRTVGLNAPHHDQVPALVEDVWGSRGMGAFARMPVAAEDFHGDGAGGDVDVVLADRYLGSRVQPAGFEQRGEFAFAGGLRAPLAFAIQGPGYQPDFGAFLAARGVMGGAGVLLSNGRVGPRGTQERGSAAVARNNAFGQQSPSDDVPGHPEAGGEGVFAFTGQVGGGDGPIVQAQGRSRWDAPAAPFAVETRTAYASRGQDLRERLASQVTLDRVVQVDRIPWSGQVFNLTSVEGWFDADGLIVSNCNCFHMPISVSGDNLASPIDPAFAAQPEITDPDVYFKNLTPAMQDATFGKAGAQAIRDGASISQVVNARQGIDTASGRVNATTTTGAGRRSLAGQRLSATGGRNVTRLMPEAIYQIAGNDRLEALRLLHLHGFVL